MLRAEPYLIACLLQQLVCFDTCQKHYEELTEAVIALSASVAIACTGNERASLHDRRRALPK